MDDGTRSRNGQRVLAMLGVLFFSGAIVLFAMRPAAASTNAGAARILAGDGTTPLASGGSATQFTIGLPPQAKCTADSTTGGMHVFGYFTTTDPATLTFDQSTGPKSGFPLVDTTGSPYVAANTAVGGQVIQIPTFDMRSYNAANGTMPTIGATYNIGIACASTSGVEDNFWNVQMLISASTSDPNGFTWALANQVAPTTTTSSTTTSSSTTSSSTTSTSSTVPRQTGSTSSTTRAGSDPMSSGSSGGSSGGNGNNGGNNGGGQLAVSGGRVATLSDWGLALLISGLATIIISGRRRGADDGGS